MCDGAANRIAVINARCVASSVRRENEFGERLLRGDGDEALRRVIIRITLDRPVQPDRRESRRKEHLAALGAREQPVCDGELVGAALAVVSVSKGLTRRSAARRTASGDAAGGAVGVFDQIF